MSPEGRIEAEIARTARPDLFALADDLLEAEMLRLGLISFDAADPEMRSAAA